MAKFKSSFEPKGPKPVSLKTFGGTKAPRPKKVKLGKGLPFSKAKTVPSFMPKVKLPGPGGTY